MRAICELAVMNCYYHNVAKFHQEDATNGFLGIGKKDKEFWIEYDGTVTIGIDASLVTVEVNDTQVTVTLPEAKVLGCKTNIGMIDGEESNVRYIKAKNSANITDDDEKSALSDAKAKMIASASADRALLSNAQQQAKTLLSQYITNLGSAFGKQYTIKWVYVDDNGTPNGTTEFETTETTQNIES